MSERRTYRVYHVVFAMNEGDGMTEGDFEDFRRALDRLEADHPGCHLLGTDETDSWPTVRVSESRRAVPERDTPEEKP